MAIKLKLCAKLINNCSQMLVQDITQEYNGTTNLTGWGTPNIDPSDVVSAYIQVYNGTDTEEFEVTDSIPASVTGNFDLITIDNAYSDGEYKVTYVVNTSTTTYESCITIFSTCNVRCCVDKMWLTFIQSIGGESSSCGCSSDINIKDVLFAEALYKSLTRAAGCLNAATRDKILSQLQKICSYSNCQCDH